MSRGDAKDGRPRAAAWWSARLHARAAAPPDASLLLDLLNRWSAPIAWAGAGLAFSGCAELLSDGQAADSAQRQLEEQQQDGWNVGGEDQPLIFPYPQGADISGGAGWRDAEPALAARLEPGGVRWLPYYNRTLFQSLEAPRNADLRAVMRPIFTPEMAIASRRGDALLSLLMENGACRADVALVLDLPGPESIAVAAALAPCFDPVFVFGNWPHPRGVVPAHQTLAAALYFLPAFERERVHRSRAAAPVLVLDRGRLAEYADDAGQFDNRYLAGLPPLEALREAGIQHVLYVTPGEEVTLDSDDINDDLMAFDQAGVDVKMLALSDFSQTPLPDWPQLPSCGAAPPAGPASPFYFGGSPGAHSCFSAWYGWRRHTPLPAGNAPAQAPAQAPVRLLPRCHFHPAPRAAAVHSWSNGGWRGGGGMFGRGGSSGRMHSGGGFG
jgi:hypothetical protein